MSDQTRLVEILFDFNLFPINKDGYVEAFDIIEELLDRICLVSYSQAFIQSFVSVCKEKVKVEEEFEIVQKYFFKNCSLNTISPQSLTFLLTKKRKLI